jgi:YD repeat-containing protein
VRNELQNLAFDSKSGVTLASAKVNSDGMGLASYAIPLHWSSGQALSANRLNLLSEERTYAMPSGTTFDRNALSRIIAARVKSWATVPMRNQWGHQQQSNHLYNVQSHVWCAPLGSDGLAATSYVAPNQAFGPPWAPAGSKVTLTNIYGYPLETRDEVTGLATASYVGHNTNLVIGVVANAKWQEASILTCDYAHPSNANYFDSFTGWRKGSSGTVTLVPSQGDVGAKAIRLENTGSIYTEAIVLDPQKPRKYKASLRSNADQGTQITMTMRPNVGPPVSTDAYYSYYFQNTELEIDLTQPDYSGATRLTVEVKASSGGRGYVQEVRVHPADALASSFFYDPITYKLVGTLDENGQYRKFAYDARGRLVSKMNDYGAETETYHYNDMVNPQ